MIITKTPADFDNPPVALDDVKSHLGINYSFDDSRILRLIWNAVDWLEQETGRTWAVQSYTWTIDRFPPVMPTYNEWLHNYAQSPIFQYGPWIPMRQRLYLPRNPVSSIDEIKYYDSTNTLTTLASDSYWFVTSEIEHACIESKTMFPVTHIRPDAVQITFTAGSTSSPFLFNRFVCEAVGWMNENREGGDIPKSLERVITLLKDGTYA